MMDRITLSGPISHRWALHRLKVLVPRTRIKERSVGHIKGHFLCHRLRISPGKDEDPHQNSYPIDGGHHGPLWIDALLMGSQLWNESLRAFTANLGVNLHEYISG